MLSFSLVAEALTGLIYHRPSGENSKFALPGAFSGVSGGHLEAGTKSKPCQHFTSSSWPSTRASTLPLSRQQPTNKEYRPRLPQQGQIAVSPWPRPQHQSVKKRFF